MVTPAEITAQIDALFVRARPDRNCATTARVAEARAAMADLKARAQVEELHHVSALGRPFVTRIYTFGSAQPTASAKAV